MRRKIVAGNWKMNGLFDKAEQLVKEILEHPKLSEVTSDIVVAPSYMALQNVSKISQGTKIKTASQDCSENISGAYTGQVSAAMVKSCGAEYVILGHSERRQYFGENSPILIKKLKHCFSENLKVIYCVGESLEERESGNFFEVIRGQLEEVLKETSSPENFIIAYEPVWAIGTGKTASANEAQEVHAFIRKYISGEKDRTFADAVSILYGGSCKPSNAREIFSKPDVDGGLIGGAALIADDFINICLALK